MVSHSMSLHMERIAWESLICERQQKSSHHGEPVKNGTVRTRSLHTSTFISSVLTQVLAGVRYWPSLDRRARRGIPALVVAPHDGFAHKRPSAREVDHANDGPTVAGNRYHDDHDPPGQIVSEVWNPLAGVYDPMGALDTGLLRLAERIEQVRGMWVRYNPRRESLKEARTLLKTATANGVSCEAELKPIGSITSVELRSARLDESCKQSRRYTDDLQ